MFKYIIDFLDKLNNPPHDIAQLIKDEKYLYAYKGYGTPELEMRFLHRVFLHIQVSHPEFKVFSWQQYNSFNDNYYHFELSMFTVNNKLIVDSDVDFFFRYSEKDNLPSNINFNALDYPDTEEIEFAQNNNMELGKYGLENSNWEAYQEYKKKKYKYLEIPCLKFLAILKLLEAHYSMYYFLYTFGNGVAVEFDKKGVTVSKFDENEMDGVPLHTGMEEDD